MAGERGLARASKAKQTKNLRAPRAEPAGYGFEGLILLGGPDAAHEQIAAQKGIRADAGI